MFISCILIWNVFCHLCAMRFLLTAAFMIGFLVRGQNYFSEHFGGTVSIIAHIGSHNTSIGFGLNGYYTDKFFQINGGSTFLLYHNALGNRRSFMENRTAIGAILLAGKENRIIDFDLGALNHQTNKNLGLGFSYILYSDSRNTSQASGAFGIHFQQFSMYHENDIFGGTGKDRFRTGQFHFSYQYERFKFETGIQLWTGESGGAPLFTDSCFHCPAGYRDLRNTAYGKTSHGIAYAGIRADMGLKQVANARLGIDSENVRHYFQNIMIHNLGQFLRRPTPHYPRLNEEGLPVFKREDARDNKPYLQLGMNNGWWY